MNRKLLSAMAILALVVAAVAVGCGGGEITGQELIDGVIASVDEQETVRYKMSMVYNMSGTVEGEYGEIDVSVDIDSLVDMVDKEMQLDMTSTMSIRADTETEETSAIKEYILGDTVYVGMVSPVSPTEWVKGDVPDDFWELENYVSQQVELLRGAEVEIVGKEKVKGVSCYVAEISPDMDRLLDFMSAQLEQSLPMELTEDSLSNYSLKGWYAKDTFFPMSTHQEFDFTFDVGEDELVAHYVIDIQMYDYNKPVSIELPSEAEEAEYVGPIEM